MRQHVLVGVAAISLTLAAAPVFAHHAFSAEFDSERPLKLQGSVIKTEWVNPHAWIHIAVKKADGTTVSDVLGRIAGNRIEDRLGIQANFCQCWRNLCQRFHTCSVLTNFLLSLPASDDQSQLRGHCQDYLYKPLVLRARALDGEAAIYAAFQAKGAK